MREQIKNLFIKTVSLKYSLPNKEIGINKTKLTTKHDFCYSVSSDEYFAKIIYNSIIDYCVDETKVGVENLNADQLNQLIGVRFRFDEDASEGQKERYGFYGEAFLNMLIKFANSSNILLAKGYLYIPTNGSEPTGYDCYHLTFNPDNSVAKIILGEVKFYQSYKRAIENALGSLKKAFSADYLRTNFLNFSVRRSDLSINNEFVNELLDKIEKNSKLNVYNELLSKGVKLVYPICIISNYAQIGDFDKTIEKCVSCVNDSFLQQTDLEMEMELQFLFVPVESAKAIKRKVIEWILKKEPLL